MIVNISTEHKKRRSYTIQMQTPTFLLLLCFKRTYESKLAIFEHMCFYSCVRYEIMLVARDGGGCRSR